MWLALQSEEMIAEQEVILLETPRVRDSYHSIHELAEKSEG